MAALMSLRLVDKVRTSLNIQKVDRYVHWCDSTIVLGWLRTSLNLLQTFVANRISNIQELSNIDDWRHVSSNSNPADCVSRGVNPKMLPHLDLYWYGPHWLHHDEPSWPH